MEHFAVDLDLVERADEVVQRRPRRVTKRRRGTEVVLEPDAQAQLRRVVDVPQHVVVVAHLVAPGEVIGDTMRTHLHGGRPPRERHRPVGAIAVDVVVEQGAHSRGSPAHAASTSVHSTPDTSA